VYRGACGDQVPLAESQMLWWQFALLGAGGGTIVEAVEVFRWVAVWQHARRSADGTLRRKPPTLRRYVDLPAHAIMLPARAALGALAAVVFGLTGQVTGPYGALAFGCAAPVLLSRLGLIPQMGKAIDVPAGSRKSAEDQPTVSVEGVVVGKRTHL
jgi:hypothetical protein